jgi:hypothetical protein
MPSILLLVVVVEDDRFAFDAAVLNAGQNALQFAGQRRFDAVFPEGVGIGAEAMAGCQHVRDDGAWIVGFDVAPCAADGHFVSHRSILIVVALAFGRPEADDAAFFDFQDPGDLFHFVAVLFVLARVFRTGPDQEPYALAGHFVAENLRIGESVAVADVRAATGTAEAAVRRFPSS